MNPSAFQGLVSWSIVWSAREVGLTQAVLEGSYGASLDKISALTDAGTIAYGRDNEMVDPLPKALWEANLLWQNGKQRESTQSFVEAARLSRLLFHNGPYLRAIAARIHLLAGAYLLLLPDTRMDDLSQCCRLFENGEDFYRHALEKPPKELFALSAEANDRMAYLLLDDGRRDEAMEYYLRAARIRERISQKSFPKAIARYRRPRPPKI